jgi:CII-binding regulator of phage lambda lysogenization HflD
MLQVELLLLLLVIVVTDLNDQLIVDQNATAKYLGEKMNLPEKLIRDEEEQKQLADRLSQLQQSPEEGGEAPPGA